MVLQTEKKEDEGSQATKKAKEQELQEETEEEDVKKQKRQEKEEDALDIPQTPTPKRRRRDMDLIRSLEIPLTPSVNGFSQAANECSPVPAKKAALKEKIFKKPSCKDSVPEAIVVHGQDTFHAVIVYISSHRHTNLHAEAFPGSEDTRKGSRTGSRAPEEQDEFR